MKSNLNHLSSEIRDYLEKRGLVIFRGLPRANAADSAILWDTEQFPDYRDFIAAAEAVEARLITLHTNEFSAAIVEEALDRLVETRGDSAGRRAIEQRLREISVYEGFTCQIELAFAYGAREYIFDLRTEWFEDLNDLLDQIDERSEEEDTPSPFGGYYSNN
jgi:hypothetical protein